jgi:hypothetical protein
MPSGIKKFALLLDADVASVPEEWRIKRTSDDVGPLRPPTQVGRTLHVVSRQDFAMKPVNGEHHIYKTLLGADVPGAIYQVRAL